GRFANRRYGAFYEMGRTTGADGDSPGERLLRRGGDDADAANHSDRAEDSFHVVVGRGRFANRPYSVAPSFFSSATVLGWASVIGGSKPSESAPAGAAARPLPTVDPNIAATNGVIPRLFFTETAAPRSTRSSMTLSYPRPAAT